MPARTKPSRPPRALLAGWILFLVATNLATAFLDKSPLRFDAAGAYHAAAHFANGLRDGTAATWDLFLQPGIKPWLMNMLAGVPLAVLGGIADPDVALLTEQLFLALLLVGVYATVLRLARDEGPAPALLAAFVTGVSPGIFGMSKTLMHDVPLAAAVWCSLALLVRTGGFRRTGTSLAFGACCGIGLMIKQPFALFVAAPVAIAGAGALADRTDRRRMAIGMLLAIGAAAIIAGPWYVLHFAEFYRANVAYNALPGGLGDLALSGRYLYWIGDFQMGWVLAGANALGLARVLSVAVLRRRYGRWLLAGALFFTVPYVYFSSTGTQLPRFTLSWVPLFAAVLAVGLTASSEGEPATRPRWSRVAVCGVVGWGLFQFLFMSLAPGPWHVPRTPLERVMGFPGIDPPPGGLHSGVFRIDRSGVTGRMICTHLRHYPAGSGELLVLGEGDSRDLVNGIARECGASLPVRGIVAFDIERPDADRDAEIRAHLETADLVLARRKRIAFPDDLRDELSLPETFHIRFEALNGDGQVAVFAREPESPRPADGR